MSEPLQIIDIGDRHLREDELQWVLSEDGLPLLRDLPLELREDVRRAFIVMPKGWHSDSVPEPFFTLLQIVENYAVLDVTYRNQLAWLVVIHK